MAKQPYIPLYTGDYLKDTRRLPLAARGAWVDLMIFMWDSKERGVLVGTMPEYAMMMSCTLDEANFAIGLLREKEICDFEIDKAGMIKLICRRMVRDTKLSKMRSNAGKKGAEVKIAKAFVKANGLPKTQANTDNDIDNDISIGIELKLKESLDELYIDQQRTKWSHIDFDTELMGFQEKVRGSPGKYIDHDVGGLRLAFQSQLRSAKRKPESKQPTKKFTLEEAKAYRK